MSLQNKFSESQNVLILVDVPNFNALQDAMQTSVDFTKLREALTGGRSLKEARLYMKGPITSAQQGFVDFVRNIAGWKVKVEESSKDIDDMINEDLKRIWPEDTNVVVLVSGDRDFVEALRGAKQEGKRIEVAGISETMSAELKGLADEFIDLRLIRDQISDPFRTAQRYPPCQEIIPFLALFASLQKGQVFLLRQILAMINNSPPKEIRLIAEDKEVVMEIRFKI